MVDGLNQMGADTPLISVKKASQKLGKILESSRTDIPDLSLLVQAIEDFKERIVPVFSKADTQKEEIDKLRDESRKLRRDKDHFRDKVKKMESLQAEVVRLKTALSETERNTDEALRLAESAKDEIAAHHATGNQWKKRVADLEQDNKRYKDMLDRHSNNARLQKEKNRKLAKQVAAFTEKLTREKEGLSTVSNEYDGDFSTHESSKIYLGHTMRTPSKSSRNTHYDENKPELEFEGIPSANFPSEWQIEGPNILRKRVMNGTIVSGQRRVANPFPITLDKTGHPIKPVQLGPRAIVHIRR